MGPRFRKLPTTAQELPSKDAKLAIDGFRQTMADRLSRWALLGVLVVLGLVAVQVAGAPEYLEYTRGWVIMLAVTAGVLAGATLKRLSLRQRAVLLVCGCSVPALWIIHRVGYLLPNAHTAMIATVVLATLLRGMRFGFWVLAVQVLALAAVGAAFVHGAPPALSLSGLDVHRPDNWVRTTAAFGVVAGIVVGAIGFLLARLSQALQESDRLLRAVVDQSAHRIAALEEQQALAEQLRQSQKLEVIGKVAGGVAHDFNNLLVVILNNAELVREASADPEVQRQLGYVVAAAERAGLLTHQLLSFGSRQPIKRDALAVNPAVERVLALIRRLLPSHVELVFRPGVDAGYGWADSIDMDQVLMNLCVNARDAMPDGGRICVETGTAVRKGPDGDPCSYVHLAVADTGRGISAGEQARIFDPFYTTKGEGRNTGLGLSVVRRVVSETGGQIEVRSTVGRGTRFDVYLPSCLAPSVQPDAPGVDAPPGTGTVLIADDDAGARQALSAQLRAAGYQVLPCADGLEALRCFDEQPGGIALVITDMVMPRMGGEALCTALSERAPDLPMLLCSGYAPDSLPADFLDHPLRGFLSKPFGSQQLLLKVQCLLDRAEAWRARDPGPAHEGPPLVGHRFPKFI